MALKQIGPLFWPLVLAPPESGTVFVLGEVLDGKAVFIGWGAVDDTGFFGGFEAAFKSIFADRKEAGGTLEPVGIAAGGVARDEGADIFGAVFAWAAWGWAPEVFGVSAGLEVKARVVPVDDEGFWGGEGAQAEVNRKAVLVIVLGKGDKRIGVAAPDAGAAEAVDRLLIGLAAFTEVVAGSDGARQLGGDAQEQVHHLGDDARIAFAFTG